MDARTHARWKIAKWQSIKYYKRQNIDESHEHLPPEELCHIEHISVIIEKIWYLKMFIY